MGQQHSNALMLQLKKHLHLVSDPFSMESHFFFEGAQRQHNLETLRHLASFGDMVLFLTGDKGAGKTHLLHKLADSSFEGLNVVYLDCELLVQGIHKSSSPILKACFRSLGVKEYEGSFSQLLNALLTECHRLVAADGVRTLFAFDNADKIPKKELQEYFSFCRGLPAESALVMLFAGSSNLIQVSKLGNNVNQNIWWHQIQIKPLSQADVLLYLDQALSHAGYSKKLELTDIQIQQLVELGKGLPGRINKLFPSVVLEPGLLKFKSKPQSLTAPVWIMFGLAGLLVVSFVFVSYQHGLLDRFRPVFSFEDDPSVLKIPVIDESEEHVRILEEKSNQQRSRLAMLDGVLKEKGINLPAKPFNNDAPPTLLISSDVNDAVTTDESEKQDLVEVSLDGGSLADKKHIGEQIVPVDVTLDSQEFEVSPQSLVEAGGRNKKAFTPSDVSRKTHAAFRSKEWLMDQSKPAYLAQVLGSYSEKTAQKFIQKIGVQKFEVYYLETEHKEKPWFVVFYGVFPAKAHAQDAVKNAPKLIRSQNPWIRSSTDVLASYPK